MDQLSDVGVFNKSLTPAADFSCLGNSRMQKTAALSSPTLPTVCVHKCRGTVPLLSVMRPGGPRIEPRTLMLRGTPTVPVN